MEGSRRYGIVCNAVLQAVCENIMLINDRVMTLVDVPNALIMCRFACSGLKLQRRRCHRRAAQHMTVFYILTDSCFYIVLR